MDDLNDCQLLEHPNETIGRLKELGAWPEADRLLRKVKQRFRRQAAKIEGPMSMAQRLEMARAAWEAVLERWPPPPGTTPLESLASYLWSTRGARHSEAGGTATLSPEAERRFNQLGETVNHIDEVIWVYQHLDHEHIGPLSAQPRGMVDAQPREAEGQVLRESILATNSGYQPAPESHSCCPEDVGKRAAGY